jgi:hypothetical protein
VQFAAGASNLKIPESGIEGISQHWGGLSRAAKAKHALGPGNARKPIGLNAAFSRPLGGHPN